MAALEKRDPGQLEKRRAANGDWYTAGEEDEEEPQGASGDGSRWAGWEEVIQAWEAAGQVAASMRMVWEDRDSVWRKAEVALTDQQMGEAREGIAGGRGEWRVRAEAVTTAILHWLESNANAADQAIKLEQEGHVPSQGNQNQETLAGEGMGGGLRGWGFSCLPTGLDGLLGRSAWRMGKR